MSKVHVVIPDIHAHPSFNNDRADYLAKFLIDVQPDVVVSIGDVFDMPSLSSYDKGRRSFQGRKYADDIASGVEFQDRMWGPVKTRKKRLPHRIQLVGNHEYRVETALDLSPELSGTIGSKDFQFETYNDIVVPYEGRTPGVITIDGISYAHFFVSGVMGRAISGEHPAYSLLTKGFTSAVQGHSHLLDYAVRTDGTGRKVMGLVCGVYQDYDSDWAGIVNQLWTRGICVLRNVEDGQYDFQFISLDSLKRAYA